MSQTLSIIIPAYNEAPTIHFILDKVLAVKLVNDIKKEIIIVNSLRGIPLSEAMEMKGAIEVKRYDDGFLHPLNFLLN